MTNLDMVDPELLPGLEMFPEMVLSDDVLAAVRENSDRMAAMMGAPDPKLATLTLEMAGAVPVRVFTPVGSHESVRHPALLHLHAGGYVVGGAQMSDVPNAQLAAELGIVIVSVDYRLAPETRHPGPIEDCYTALRWLHDEAERLTVDPTRIAVGGESAGGGLAAALALLARDRGEVKLVFQHLIYPMLDDRTAVDPDPNPHVGAFIWTPAANRFGWTALLGETPGGENVSPYAAAARATDLSGLPPAFISVGALDLFVEEDMEYARRLMRAGVATELHVFPGAFHAFDIVPTARSAMVARNRSRAALRGALHPRK